MEVLEHKLSTEGPAAVTKHISCEVRLALKMMLLGQSRRYIGYIEAATWKLALIKSEKVVDTHMRNKRAGRADEETGRGRYWEGR